MYRKLRAPITVQIEITEQCNSSCLHCYNHWRVKKTKRYLDLASINRIVQKLVSNEVFDVTITGGEPLLRPLETLYMVQMLNDARINFSMNTNLRLLAPSLAAQLKDAGLQTILTSFVSHDSQRHAQITQSEMSYDQVVKGIRVAREYGFRVAANMVLSKINFTDLRETARFLYGLGVINFCATKMSLPSDLRDIHNILLDKKEIVQSLMTLVELESEFDINVDILECYPLCLIKDGKKFAKFFRRSCVAGVSACTIGSNGAVRPCSHANEEYGNILTEPLEKIWARMNNWRNGSYVPTKCKACSHFRACTGGCRIDAYTHGDIRELDPCAEPENLSQITYPNKYPAHDGILYQFPPFNSRVEDFGHIIYSQRTCFPVNNAGFKILNNFRFTSFFLDDFDGEHRDFLRHLVMLGFASPVTQQQE